MRKRCSSLLPFPPLSPQAVPLSLLRAYFKNHLFYEVLETDRAELAAPPLCASITSTLFIQQLFMQLLLCANPMKQTYVVFVLLEHTMRETNIKSSHTDKQLQTEISVMKPLHVPKKKKKKKVYFEHKPTIILTTLCYKLLICLSEVLSAIIFTCVNPARTQCLAHSICLVKFFTEIDE